MGYSTRTVTVVAIISLIQISAAFREVLECPTEEASWRARASKLKCDLESGKSYHCIKDDREKLIESCLTKLEVPAGIDGCPWVFIDDEGSVIFGAVNNVCNKTSCPFKNHTGYYTDQLYKYPGCIGTEHTVPMTTMQIPCYCNIENNCLQRESVEEDSSYMFYIVIILKAITGFVIGFMAGRRDRELDEAEAANGTAGPHDLGMVNRRIPLMHRILRMPEILTTFNNRYRGFSGICKCNGKNVRCVNY